ncbi:MAG: D-aminoacyl-tRNA deacylase [Methanomassiliicoccaceae archaeon]|jgi:D-aminoacyl-tRNA deacylase|nr:D-aminoacyl-tRNA deacylase [Methanomassiliicoccaceae archaeon]
MGYKLLLCSEEDIASVNIRNALISSEKWEDDGDLLYFGNMAMMTIRGIHIRAENVDEKAKNAGIDAEEIIFLSRHKAASGIPTLTVHPIGNFQNADLGGRSWTLVRSSPRTMTGLLRSLSSIDTQEFQVSFEVTHHGPWVNIPATFIEIGSDESQWNNKDAAMMISDAIYNLKEDNYEAAIGIGGGHYAPRFTEISLTHEINFGHMIPEYAIKDSDDDDLIRILKDSAKNSDTRLAYVHKKSMKSDQARRVANAITSCNLEAIDSSCLNEI